MRLRLHVFLGLVVCPLLLLAQSAGLSRSLELALRGFRGRVGVAVVYGRGDSLVVAGDVAHSYPLSSVVKFHQALYVLGRAPGCGIPVSRSGKRWRPTSSENITSSVSVEVMAVGVGARFGMRTGFSQILLVVREGGEMHCRSVFSITRILMCGCSRMIIRDWRLFGMFVGISFL